MKPIEELRKRLGAEAVKASEAHSERVVIDMSDMRLVLVALDEMIEPIKDREVKL